jgi:hypothetical protein
MDFGMDLLRDGPAENISRPPRPVTKPAARLFL